MSSTRIMVPRFESRDPFPFMGSGSFAGSKMSRYGPSRSMAIWPLRSAVSSWHRPAPTPPRENAAPDFSARLEIALDPLKQAQGDLLSVDRLAEQQEGGEDLLVNVSRFEDPAPSPPRA